MYCKYCGKEIDNNSKYCQHCGKEIKEEKKQMDKSGIEAIEKDDKKTIKIAVTLFIIITVITAIVIGALLMNQEDQNGINRIIKSRDTKISDITLVRYKDYATSIDLKITANYEIENLKIEIIFYDKNNNILATKYETFSQMAKGESRIISYSITEFNTTTILNLTNYTVKIISGKTKL